MIFKQKPNQPEDMTLVCDGRVVGKFDQYGYMKVKDDLFIARMKRAGYEEAKPVYCECGLPFENKGDFLTHVKTCPARGTKDDSK